MNSIKKVILLGSGGLTIGQAGEFDYSGCQAIKSLESLGIEVIIINPNIATVQTTPHPQRKVYLYPVEPQWVEKVILQEKPDGIIAGFGGQTALNCVIRLDELGILARHQVRNLGTPIEVLRLTEDRDLFAKKMLENEIPVPPSIATTSVEKALEAADTIGYPVIARAAFALGGLGSGFAQNPSELKLLVESALSSSPQVLIEKSLKGWKEVEYEVMRDSFGNAITICNMENFDPLGVHTGDSIVVAPSQTLTDEEYQLLRNTSLKIVQLLKIVGECNVQFALNPNSRELYVIEINARLSRSSALASKATGYPIALIAAQVVLGKSLLEIKNPLTATTTAYFEPALDYITVKIPRWDLKKFKGASRLIGTTMKSIGEVMAIGRTFGEALQKAIRMVSEDESTLGPKPNPFQTHTELLHELSCASDTRLLGVLNALRSGLSPKQIHQATQIDPWFLDQLVQLIGIEQEIIHEGCARLPKNLTLPYQPGALLSLISDIHTPIPASTWRHWKSHGMSDSQIATLWFRALFPQESSPSQEDLIQSSMRIRSMRELAGVKPVIKKIDTSAAEFPAPSNYLYLTYSGTQHDEITFPRSTHRATVLGGGAYRIGSSVEFDWSVVSCLDQLRHSGWSCSVINFNPETVSTDFNSSDRLYFDELSLERILDILEFEKPEGVIASMSGQLPNRLAPELAQLGIPLLGHTWESIDQAENRKKFSALLDRLQIPQPQWTEACSESAITQFIQEQGYPILIRPSYVLSGAAMNVATDEDSLNHFLSLAQEVSQDYPVVLSRYYEGAQEAELDGVSQAGNLLCSLMSEHIENAGVHSGDATLIFPPQTLSKATQERMKEIATQISSELKLNGPFNLQFLIHDSNVLVIECNVRASRSFPFVSKVAQTNLIHLATQVITATEKMNPIALNLPENQVGVKAAMFSYQRLAGADPRLGVEMASTGEVGCIGRNWQEALLLSLKASHIHPPKKGVFLSAGRSQEKIKLLESANFLQQRKIPIFATPGTAGFLESHGIRCESVPWENADSRLVQLIQSHQVDFVVNIPKNYSSLELSQGYRIRTLATTYGCTLMTNAEKLNAFFNALTHSEQELDQSPVVPLPAQRKFS